MKTLPYSTIGGQVTRGETYAQMLDYLRQAEDFSKQMSHQPSPETYLKLTHSLDMAQEASAVIGHLHNTEDSDFDKTMAKGWIGVSEMFKLTRWKITRLAQGSPHPEHWAAVAKTFEEMIWHLGKLFESKRQ